MHSVLSKKKHRAIVAEALNDGMKARYQTEFKADPRPEDVVLSRLTALASCDAVMMLHDWERSQDAKVEHAFAQKIQLPIYYQDAL